MQRVIVFSFCLVFCFALDSEEDRFDTDYELADHSNLDVNRYKAELAAGNPSEFRTGNVHYKIPSFYKDLSRRFVPVYPYKEVKSAKKAKKHEDRDLIPIRAPPELVLAVMKNAVKSNRLPKPSDPTEEVIRQYMLRSGDYWDGVWKEEVNPDSLLRTNKNEIRASDQDEEVDALPITAKLVPGSKLYDLIAGVVKHSPRLVYIINDE